MKVRLVLSALLLAAVSPRAWEVSGKVTEVTSTTTNPAAAPIPGAQVCAQGTSNCATTSATGTFTLSGTDLFVNPSRGIAPEEFSLEFRLGQLFLRSPRALAGKVQWIEAGSGRTYGLGIGEGGSMGLAPGMNRLAVPAPQSSAGVHFLRLVSGNLQVTWKVVLGSLVEAVSPATAAGQSLAKAADVAPAPILTVTKTGYKDRNYYATDPVKDDMAWVLLAHSNDDTTYALPGTSYPAAAVPPNVVTGRAHVGGGQGYAYGGAKVNNILGHSAGGNGTLTYGKIFAPADGDYDITWGYYCGKSDNNGDANCGGDTALMNPSGCRPGIMVINGTQLPKTYQFKCFAAGWDVIHFATFSLPLKAGYDNTIKIYSTGPDVADLDRIIVKDGR